MIIQNDVARERARLEALETLGLPMSAHEKGLLAYHRAFEAQDAKTKYPQCVASLQKLEINLQILAEQPYRRKTEYGKKS